MTPRNPPFQPIAIVGMACRFPGGANDLESFWTLLETGGDASREIPIERWNADRWYDPRPNAPGKTYARRASLLTDVDVRDFDAAFFGIPPVEARALDPHHRMLLEVAWEAIEHAGIGGPELSARRAGVFVGIMNHEFERLLSGQGVAAIDAYGETGTGFDMAGGRISYLLDLRGPNIVIDTACSSSLVALHLACRSLQAGECGIALVGGVNVLLSAERMIRCCRMLAISPDGRSKAFDAGADGFGRGEGCGVVVLKPLADALADGDRVLAVVRQTSVNHGGRGTGLTVPNASAQEELVRGALAQARVAPADVSYFETHGTGTPVGDPVEFASIASVMREGRPADRPLLIGSVKTNIGHLEAGAGVAGLIKVVLSMQHRTIPPHLHLATVNPAIDLDVVPARIPTEPVPWEASGARLAGINSFGMGGTNAFALIEEAPEGGPAPSAAAHQPGAAARADAGRGGAPWLLPISARSPAALAELAGRYRAALSTTGGLAAAPLRDVCLTAARGRSHHRYRAAAIGETHEQLAERLADAGSRALEGSAGRTPRIALVFAGHGSQWAGMGRELIETEPVFRAALEACDRALRPHMVGFSVVDLLTSRTPDPLNRVQRVQPTIFAVQVALAALWRHWGIEPAAVAGHSMSEVLAAHVAGVLDLDQAAKLVALRARLLGRVSGLGAMLAVGLPFEEARALAAADGRISVAARNAPRSSVLSGDAAALDAIRERLEREGVFARAVNSDVAMHSHQLDPLLEDMRAEAAEIRSREARLPLYSTVTGTRVGGAELGADHWVASLRQPVQLQPAVERLIADGYDVLLEVSPHPVLGPALKECAEAAGRPVAVASSLRRGAGERSALLSSLATLYAQGAEVSWENVYPGAYRRATLPSYPWQRVRHWNPGMTGDADAAARSAGGHPLHERHVRPSTDPGSHVWEVDLSVRQFPWLGDHRVHGSVVFPGAGYLEMALAAAHRVLGETAYLEDVGFEQALVLPEDGARTLQLILRAGRDGRASFSFHSFATEPGSGEEPARQSHASGWARAGWAEVASSEPVRAAEDRLAEQVRGDQYYDDMANRGLAYGPAFRGIASLWRRDREAGAALSAPEAVVFGGAEYELHPALLDAALQVAAAVAPPDVGASETLLPVGVRRVVMHRRPDATARLRVRAKSLTTPADAGETIVADVVLTDERGRRLAEVQGLTLRRLPGAPAEAEPWSDWTYQLSWRRDGFRIDPSPDAGPVHGPWLIVADRGPVAAALAELIRARGERCAVLEADRLEQTLAQALERTAPRRVVHLGGLDLGGDLDPDGDALAAQACMALTRVVQALGRGDGAPAQVAIVTRGADGPSQDGRAGLAGATLWGLGRVLGLEHPELRRRNIDLPPTPAPGDAAALLDELLLDEGEDEVALREDGRYVARLGPWAPSRSPRLVPAGDRAFRLVPSATGIVDRMVLHECARRAPGPGEIEVEVEAAALNFRDVLAALASLPALRGEDPDAAFGLECAGRVVGVGEAVTEPRVGDPVVAVARNSIARFVTAPAARALPQPPSLSAAQACALISAYGTALHAFDIARLRRGERVLVHAAAGGVGLAAVHAARALGAEVFATAGRAEKRDYLRDLGVEHVMDSRTLAWADEVMAATGGKGVDLVLNSLGGEAIEKGVACLAPFGRFVEIGKRDIYADLRLGLLPFRRNLSYMAVDLLGLERERPEEFDALARRVLDRVGRGELPPLPVTVFPVSDAARAVALMQRGEHIGKVVLALRDENARVEPVAGIDRAAPPVRSDGSYLITGGLGGIGLVTARWLADRGARHVALLGRGAPSAEALAEVRALEARGVRVLLVAGDVAKRADLERVLAEIDAALPPLRGVFHAAGVVDDVPLAQSTAERAARVLAPKVNGSWNLHRLLEGRPIELFVLYSSIASLLGWMAQSSYAAGNAFMDALARHRRARGLPALSVNWGPWSDVGMAARLDEELRARMAGQGVSAISPDRGTRLLDRILGAADAPPQVGAFRIDWDVHRGARGSLSSVLAAAPHSGNGKRPGGAGADGGVAGALLRRLESTPIPLRARAVAEHVAEQVAVTLGYAPTHALDVRAEFSDLGLDSLRAMELRNRLQLSTGRTLRSMVVFEHPSILALSGHIGALLQPDGGAAPAGAPEPPQPAIVERPAAPAAAEASDEVLAERVAGLTDSEIELAMEEKLRRLMAE